jgi:hypothetical protein
MGEFWGCVSFFDGSGKGARSLRVSAGLLSNLNIRNCLFRRCVFIAIIRVFLFKSLAVRLFEVATHVSPLVSPQQAQEDVA